MLLPPFPAPAVDTSVKTFPDGAVAVCMATLTGPAGSSAAIGMSNVRVSDAQGFSIPATVNAGSVKVLGASGGASGCASIGHDSSKGATLLVLPLLLLIGRRWFAQVLLLITVFSLIGTVAGAAQSFGVSGTWKSTRTKSTTEAAAKRRAASGGFAEDQLNQRLEAAGVPTPVPAASPVWLAWDITKTQRRLARARAAVQGRLVVVGGNSFASANSRSSSCRGGRFKGSVLDPNHHVVANIRGIVTPRGIRGTFRATSTGERGRFSWTAPNREDFKATYRKLLATGAAVSR